MEKEKYNELKEKASHGDNLLAFAKYRTRIPKNFTSYPMHWHDEMEIIYVKEGTYIVNIDFEQYEVNAGSIIILPPGALHSFKQNNNEYMMSYTILFDISMLENIKPDICSLECFIPFLEGKFDVKRIVTAKDEGFNELAQVIDSILDIYDNKKSYYELMIKSKLFEVFYILLNNMLITKDERIISRYDVSDNIKVIIDYIQNNYMNQIFITDLAELLKFSDAHFMRYFKKHVGVTCVEYINDYRISVAAKQLVSTNLTVGDIANKVGVPNISYFNRMFKKSYGVSPVEFRKNSSK